MTRNTFTDQASINTDEIAEPNISRNGITSPIAIRRSSHLPRGLNRGSGADSESLQTTIT
jgi:hypothetical protein